MHTFARYLWLQWLATTVQIPWIKKKNWFSLSAYQKRWHRNRNTIHDTIRYFMENSVFIFFILIFSIPNDSRIGFFSVCFGRWQCIVGAAVICYCYCGIVLRNRKTTCFCCFDSFVHVLCSLNCGTSNFQSLDEARLAFVINKIIWSILIDSLSHFAMYCIALHHECTVCRELLLYT